MQRTACLRLHVLSGLLEQLREADMRISSYDRQIRALAEASEPARRLMRVESIGPQTATALVATVGDPHVFKNGRGFAAWLGRIAWAILAHGTEYRPAGPKTAVA